MLLDGEIDAAVVGDKLPDPRLKHLIADHEAAAQRWAQQHRGIPINHMVVVRSELSKSRPDVVKEVFRLLVESKNAAGAPRTPSRSGSVSRRAAPCSRPSSTIATSRGLFPPS